MAKKEVNKPKKVKAAKQDAVIKPENYFVLNSGGVIKDIVELESALEYMIDDDFRHHVTPERNDFSNWIRDIFKETELADKIAPMQDKKDIRIAILKSLLNKK
jgi:hypothetical protein